MKTIARDHLIRNLLNMIIIHNLSDLAHARQNATQLSIYDSTEDGSALQILLAQTVENIYSDMRVVINYHSGTPFGDVLFAVSFVTWGGGSVKFFITGI